MWLVGCQKLYVLYSVIGGEVKEKVVNGMRGWGNLHDGRGNDRLMRKTPNGKTYPSPNEKERVHAEKFAVQLGNSSACQYEVTVYPTDAIRDKHHVGLYSLAYLRFLFLRALCLPCMTVQCGAAKKK